MTSTCPFKSSGYITRILLPSGSNSHSLVSKIPESAVELVVIGSEDAEVVHIARGYVDADPEVYKNP